MSNFNIEEEIDGLVDKLCEQLKDRLKKMVLRSERIVLKQYVASQKETKVKNPTSIKARVPIDSRNSMYKKSSSRDHYKPKREADYNSSSSGSEY